ncbi:MAG TPA: hypothetical protein EYQ66_08855 [Myxococcales bacterium]|nr:hypothetical protein [Myxococcales bacterium]
MAAYSVIAVVSGIVLGSLASLVLAYRPQWVVLHPRGILMLVAVLTVLAGQALLDLNPPGLRIRIDPSSESLLALGDPVAELYREAVRDFGHDEIYAVALECPEVFHTDCLSSLERVSNRVAHLEGVRSVSSLVDATSLRWVESEEWIEIKPFIESVPEDRAILRELRHRALNDVVYRRTLVAEDAKAAALNIGFQEMDDAFFLASGLDDSITGILAGEVEPQQSYHVAGRPHTKVHVYNGIVRDLWLLIPLAIVLMGIVLWAFFRTLRGVVLPLGTALAANIWTFGAMAELGESLTLLSGMLGPLLLAIGSVYGVHVVARYDEEAREAPNPARAALVSLEQVRLPALIASLTTVIGFAALLITDVPAVFQLGLFAMLGIVASTLIALVGIPAALAIFPLPVYGPGVKGQGGQGPSGGLDVGLAKLARLVGRHSALALGVWVALGLGAVALLPHIEVDTDYLSYFAPDDPLRQDFEAVNRLLAGVVPIYVVIDGDGPGSFRDPDLVRAVDALEDRLSVVPGVSRTLSFNDMLGRLNRAFHADEPEAERVPDSRAAITELLFMLPKDDLTPFLTVDHSRANVIVRTGAVGSSAILELERKLQEVLDSHPLPRGAQARITGNAILLAHSADAITRAQPRSVGLAAVAIFGLITLALRSPGLGFVAMIPNLVPVLLFFGLLGAGLAPLSLPVSLIGSMALGIAIDDSAHFLVRYTRERRRGGDPIEAAMLCSRHVGRPIVITSVMLCLGFLVVTASRFATLQEFGFLSALTMGVCLATDLILLPAVLTRFRV